MNPFAVCAFAVAATGAIIVLRRTNSDLALIASAVAGVLVFAYILNGLTPFFDFLGELADESGVSAYFSVMLKALGISACCRIGSEICKDSGENALASKVELAGKVSIVILSLPLVKQLLEIAKDMT